MLTLAAALVLAGAIAVPHTLRLEQAPPAVAATIWGAALLLRALTMAFVVLALLLFVPATELFALVTHWCWHGVLPFLATHVPLDGHTVGDAAVVLPAFVIAALLLWAAFGLWRAARAVQRLLARAVVGDGPRSSLVLADREFLVAAAGIRRPRVVVSAGALLLLDDEELAASLEHEHGHIARRHRWALIGSELCRAVSVGLPGTRIAARELSFHLERDADLFAVRRSHDPVVLASAICKAASGSAALPVPAANLAASSVLRRVQQLIGEPEGGVRAPRLPLRPIATLMCVLVVGGAAALPAAAGTGAAQAAASAAAMPLDCAD